MPGRGKGLLLPMLAGAWDGLRLRCPACRQGRMGKGLFDLQPSCPRCGAPFEPEEGDFIGGVLVAYSVTAVLIVIGIYLVAVFTDLSARAQALLWAAAGTVFVVLTYRNMKGAWVGILHAMTGLRRLGKDS